ncbi:hypothetical protein TW85_13835 [Marinomonas sp. S3726]|uniref:hypothetical protein n=1 Tax=Marinomonas sp. S3726 TaxID=579484 RepID=UPI0005FA0053|nr:hypothetical protein [Marinomonas sp. S3726]KJZ13296.1 hypothetical protein TW85_13835 [Marinomonas sp. S3726]
MQPEQLIVLRRADIKAAIVIIIVSLLMIFESASFPLTDSYAGIQNAWYVSPALFPILIASILLICGVTLLFKGLAFVRAHKEIPVVRTSQASRWRFVLLVSLISGMVFSWVPLIDFAISSFTFLFLFILAFYSDSPALQHKVLTIWTSVSLILLVLYQTSALSEGGRNLLDWGALLFALLMVGIFRKWSINLDCFTKWKTSVKTAFIVTLVVCPIFRLGMLVPLPTEGIVIEKMVDAKYLVRDMWRGN